MRNLFSQFKQVDRRFYTELMVAKEIFANKAKTFTQRREDAKAAQRKSLRGLCVSASLRALLFFGCALFTLGGSQ
ncbi:MAG: hypothetical protein AAB354_11575 [candidate division KSB1 bacterium]